MAPAKSARAKKFAAFEEKAVKGMHTFAQITQAKCRKNCLTTCLTDYDPEANAPSADDSDSEADEDLEGTEHYVNVGYVLPGKILRQNNLGLTAPTARVGSVKRRPQHSVPNTAASKSAAQP
jgi:hypothetical protein